MTQKRSRLPGWMPGATSAGGTTDTLVGQAPIRARLVSLLLRPTPPPLMVGLGVATSFIVAETLCVYMLKQVAPGNAQGVVYLLGVLVVSTGWGLGLAVLTSLASALAFDYVRNWPPAEPQNLVAIVVFLAVGLLANTLAGVARSRAAEADQRRREAEASRDELRVLAEQQASLRRVATLVARGVEPSEVFGAVTDEMRRRMDAMTAGLWRFETSGELTLLAGAAADPALLAKWPVGTRTPIEGNTLASTVLRTGRAARMDDYENVTGSIAERVRNVGVRAAVGVPVIVDGRLWGLAAVGSINPGPMPADTEARIGDFAELVATTTANAATRDELRASRDTLSVLAAQQSALRRVATLVARGVSPSEVFSAVADEMARCLRVGHAAVFRHDPDDALIPLALYHDGLQPLPKGLRLQLTAEPLAARVLSTAATARMDRSDDVPAPHGGRMRGLGIHSAVGVPIAVDQRVWGVAIVGSLRPDPLPADTEARMHDFADLVATAIANAATRAELIASRARIVTAADNARLRLERNLHDGAQQRLVSLGLALRMAEGSVTADQTDLRDQLSRISTGLTGVSEDLREIARGIHPAILSKGGLGPALKTLARRCSVPVVLDVTIDRRLSAPVEVAAYYVVAEALTNAAKHSHASQVSVRVETQDGNLRLLIQDDGIGDANSTKGSGLIGLKDRVEALGGDMQISSPRDSGTSLHITIPLAGG